MGHLLDRPVLQPPGQLHQRPVAAFQAAGKLALSVDTKRKGLSETSRMAAVNSTPRASRSRFGCTASSSPNSERPTSATRAAASAQYSGSGIFRRYGEAFLCCRRRVGRAASHGSLCLQFVARSTPPGVSGSEGQTSAPSMPDSAEPASSPRSVVPSCSDSPKMSVLIPDDCHRCRRGRENASRSWRQETGAQAKASLRPPDINLIPRSQVGNTRQRHQ